MTFMEHALQYAKDGFAVFPLKGKHPIGELVPHGFKNATTDAEIIKKWWSRYPKANIGIATGTMSNGVFVIDVDVQEAKNKDGIATLNAWEKIHGTIPDETWTCLTGRGEGGYHLYFHSDSIVGSKNDLYPAIDIKGEGGYVVAPPSIHPDTGLEYTWELMHHPDEHVIMDANDLVYKFLSPAKETVNESFQADEVIEEGKRNETIFKYVCSLQAKGYDNESIFSSALLMNKARCVTPLPNKDLKTIMKSALRYEKGSASGTHNGDTVNEKNSTKLISMNDIQEETMEWLVPDFIPKGIINIVAGDGGVGKTTTWCNIVASVSCGKPCFFEQESLFYDMQREPQKVIFFSSEDDPRYSLKKRLRLNGAIMENILTVPISDDRFKDVKFNSEYLEELIISHKPALVVFDPIQSFIPSDVNMGYRNNMRAMLNPLIGYGEKYGVTSMIMVHTNKRENSHGRNRISDSADIWDIARNVFIIGHAGEDNLRYLSQEKINNAVEQNTVIFTIDDGVPIFKEATHKKDRDFMNTKVFEKKNKGSKDEAEEFVLEYLQDGEKETSDLNNYMESLSVSKETLKRAKANLRKKGLINYRSSGQAKEKKHFTFLIQEELLLDTCKN